MSNTPSLAQQLKAIRSNVAELRADIQKAAEIETAEIEFPTPATATEFKALVLDWLQGRVDLGISDEDACEAFQNMSDNYLSFDEWEQFCIQNDMA